MLGNVQNQSPKKRATTPIGQISFSETYSSKVDLIWHLRLIRKGHNDRILIIFVSCFHQKLDFDLVFTI